ncbi:carboxypeptidase-like regulatory domain-containing protein [Proteiniphilum sp. UBA5384]|uniref:carboxypeptidase-like regulatory domain-containing protein n=1 Tax=Proteiniphilum sp. UBA5384 TaxID=1947279 RepID=UPI0025ECBBBB|nr:carboxypeptidase-like regulatory domain-containing protein [Proteiniphilum sp. UBA5384]
MRTLLMFACALLISSAFASTDKKSENKSKEFISILQLTGSVVDGKNKETLAGAAIIVDGKKYYTDLDGQFTITDVTPGKYKVKVELISYEPYTTEIDFTKNKKLNISLLQK